MRASLRMPIGLALVLLLVPLSLCSCRTVVRDTSQAGFEAAQEWWTTTGKDQATSAAKDISQAAIDAGREKLTAEWQAKLTEIQKKVDEETATPWELLLYVLLGGVGAGGTKTLLERLLIGARQVTIGASGVQP